jgi:hypothetical protein
MVAESCVPSDIARPISDGKFQDLRKGRHIRMAPNKMSVLRFLFEVRPPEE